MLTWLKVRNLALVEEATVEWGAGLNVITGETGAGKSVLMGALALLLGERADAGAARRLAAELLRGAHGDGGGEKERKGRTK